MKKIGFLFLFASLLISCGGNNSAGEENKAAGTDITSNPDYKKGLALIADSDCLTCHRVDEASTGPSYREVANKYAAGADTAVSYLAGKIISGGKGNWGEAYMTPHSDLSQEEAEAMVKYILLLKK